MILVIDMCVTSVLMIVIEKRIFKDQFILFSPYTMMQLSLLFVYILPFLFYNNTETHNYISRIDKNSIDNLLTYIRVFYYLFCAFSIKSFLDINKKFKRVPIRITLPSSFMLVSIFILIGIIVLGELIITDFNLGVALDKMIHPRKYTYFRSGLGMFNHAVGLSKYLLMFCAIYYKKQKKGVFSLCILSISLVITLAGGSKSSLAFLLFYIVIITQKLDVKLKKINLVKLSFYIGILFLVIVFSFMIMGVNQEKTTFGVALGDIVGYSQEAFFSAQVINDFNWSPSYTVTVIKSLVFTVIPRNIFPSKGYYGLYYEYWKPMYQPNSPVFHTSTYGFLAEGHMLFNSFAPVVYAILFSLLIKKIHIIYYTCDKLASFFIISYLINFIYFMVRTGMFMASSIWVITIYYLGSKIFFSILIFFRRYKQLQ